MLPPPTPRLRCLLPFLLLLLLVVSGCRQREIEAPFPEIAEDLVVLDDLPPSILNVPVTYDLTSVLAALERAVPRSFGDMEEERRHPSNERMAFAFEVERGPFQARMDGETARISATLRYRGRGWYDPPLLPRVSASCGTDGEEDNRPRAVVSLASPLTIAPDWTLQSSARVVRVAPASDEERDQCRVTTFGIDVTDRVIDAARSLLEGNTPRIDAEVATVDLRSRIERVWGILQEPIRLTDDVWLVIRPREIRRGSVEGEGHSVTARVGLTAHPRIVLGAKPAVDSLPLPPLEPAAVGDGLHILMEGRADYDAGSRLLTRELGGMELQWGDNRVRLRELRISGIGGGRLAVEVDFDGSARGRVYLVGTPAYDLEADEIHVPDLDFDVATGHLLVGGVAWLAHGNLVQFLRERARLPVGDVMALAQEQLLRGLNRELSDEVSIGGEVLTAQALGVQATRDALVVRSVARARAQLTIAAP